MHNPPSPAQRLALLLTTGLLSALGWLALSQSALADSPETAPPELTRTIADLDAAANRRDLDAVLRFYSPSFSDADGVSQQNLRQILERTWQRYSQLSYKTQLQSWERQGDNLVAQIKTEISGVQRQGEITLSLQASLSARQNFQRPSGSATTSLQIAQQEILSEQSQLTSGTQPPKVEMNLPEQVAAGREYSLDVIVIDPVGDNLLLGTALEEAVSLANYTNQSPVTLELLSAGGIFKIGRAPREQGSRWISVIIVSEGGSVQVSRRLRIVNGAAATSPASQVEPPKPATAPRRSRPAAGPVTLEAAATVVED